MPTPAPRLEFLPQDPQGFDSWQARDDVRRAVTALALHTAGEAIAEPQAADNPWTMAPAASTATAYPAILSKPHTAVLGTPGTVLKSLTLGPNSSAQLTGVRVLGAATLAAGAVLMAVGCRFDQQVDMANGARAHFIGSFLNGVNNAGAAGNAYIVGCHQDSGVDVNVTVVAQT